MHHLIEGLARGSRAERRVVHNAHAVILQQNDLSLDICYILNIYIEFCRGEAKNWDELLGCDLWDKNILRDGFLIGYWRTKYYTVPFIIIIYIAATTQLPCNEKVYTSCG